MTHWNIIPSLSKMSKFEWFKRKTILADKIRTVDDEIKASTLNKFNKFESRMKSELSRT